MVELSGELPVGPLRLLARGSLGWALGGPTYASDAHGIADELAALVGIRLGRDRAWGDYARATAPTWQSRIAISEAPSSWAWRSA